MKQTIAILTLLIVLFMPVKSMASIQAFNASGTNLGHFSDVKCTSGLACSKVSGKLSIQVNGAGSQSLYGFLDNVISTSGDLTASQCGSAVSSDATVLFDYNLPAATTALKGCKFSFIVGARGAVLGTQYKGRISVNPVTADQILLLTNAAGDAVTSDAAGNSVVLQVISQGLWAPVGKEQGTWTDSN